VAWSLCETGNSVVCDHAFSQGNALPRCEKVTCAHNVEVNCAHAALGHGAQFTSRLMTISDDIWCGVVAFYPKYHEVVMKAVMYG
jgi:hypothetical protein